MRLTCPAQDPMKTTFRHRTCVALAALALLAIALAVGQDSAANETGAEGMVASVQMRERAAGLIQAKPAVAHPEPVSSIRLSSASELDARLAASWRRLHEEKYHPDNVFLTNEQSHYWPGDTEGRTVLALTKLAQATGLEPVHLDEILRRFPEKMNSRGYFGDIAPEGICDEQQLSSHGWVLRGLCEHYQWRPSVEVGEMIQGIVTNLVLPTKGKHRRYPIDPTEREHGGSYSGSRRNAVKDGWVLSTDIGCDYIFMDGVIHAYTLFPSTELRAVIDEMTARFLQLDLAAVKAQTHATLTGLRGLLRYHSIHPDASLLEAVEERYALYRRLAITENYENYNWFDRPTHTEPCGIVDSFMVATQLWQATGNHEYLEDAHLIFYNGIAATQRSNGGFGCNECLGSNGGYLRSKVYEAHWCCTMRGAEGLAAACHSGFFQEGNRLYVTGYLPSRVSLKTSEGVCELEMTCEYPFGAKTEIAITESNMASPAELRFFVPRFAECLAVRVNGHEVDRTPIDGFVRVPIDPQAGTRVGIELKPCSRWESPINKHTPGSYAVLAYGPLLLGAPGPPSGQIDADEVEHLGGRRFRSGTQALNSVYRLLNPDVPLENESLLVLFDDNGADNHDHDE